MNFLTCKAKAILNLVLEVDFQGKNGIRKKIIQVDSDTVYKITVADNMAGLMTYNCRIVGYTMATEKEVLSYVNNNTKPTAVDTLKLDCSDNNMSKTISINVSDIRNIEELSTSGFDEIVNREVPTFR